MAGTQSTLQSDPRKIARVRAGRILPVAVAGSAEVVDFLRSVEPDSVKHALGARPTQSHSTAMVLPQTTTLVTKLASIHGSTRLLPLWLSLGLMIPACGGDTPPSPPTTPAPPTTPTPPTPTPDPPATSWPQYGEFTDSQGRSILYQLNLKEGWDPSQPRGVLIFFHGNNTETQAEVIEGENVEFEPALDLGLAVARVGSPDVGTTSTAPIFRRGFPGQTRHWYPEDARLVHELLQGGFNSTMAVDYDRIVFWGGSQGTSFLAKFLERYIGLYGGGFHAWCGSFWDPEYAGVIIETPPRFTLNWAPSFPWTPFSSALVSWRFKVWVQVTTGDFLHDHGIAMTKYYGEVLGLQTRSDLEAPGGHCYSGAVPEGEIWEWLSRGDLRTGVDTRSDTDADGDGIANGIDRDDDNDGAWDFLDALPFDPRDYLDTDGDGIGNFEDRDADGDGVNNTTDRFPLTRREWLDTDEDGIGNNLDDDDDNDGLPDGIDSLPLEGSTTDQLSFIWRGVSTGGAARDLRPPVALVHSGKPSSFVYPEPRGDLQSYQFIHLGNGAESRFQLMIDRVHSRDACATYLLPEFCDDPPSAFSYFEHYADRIYVDRNHNGDLTDDGPPMLLARNREDRGDSPGASTFVEVSYASGETLPYGLRFWTSANLSEGISYMVASFWIGNVQPTSGEPVLLAIADFNSDGIFDSAGKEAGQRVSVRDTFDFACVDSDRNGELNECDGWSSIGDHVGSVRLGGTFVLDRGLVRLMVSPTGKKVELVDTQ